MCTLLVFVDAAASRIMHLSFVPSESAFSYFQAAKSYLTTMARRSLPHLDQNKRLSEALGLCAG
jgi:hypothetical protein